MVKGKSDDNPPQSQQPSSDTDPKPKVSTRGTKSMPTKGKPTADDSKDNPPQKVVSIESKTPLPTVDSKHRHLDKCPCGQSKPSAWQIDCSRCNQIWHADCLSFKGIKQDSINRMVEYLCPFCYTAPIPTAPCTDVDVCHICRNTLVLQQSNNEHELKLATEHSQKLDMMVDRLNTLNDEINAKIDKLQSISTANITLSASVPSSSSASGYSPFTDDKDNSVKLPSCEEDATAGYLPDFLEESDSQALLQFLQKARSDGEFKQKNGRETLAFGVPYRWASIYNESSKEKEIPDILKPLLVKAQKACGPLHEELNSILVNYYPGKKSSKDPPSHMPKHSDYEFEITPESSIATYSLGASRTMSFSEIHGDQTASLDVENNSLYFMTKTSQSWFKHSMLDVEVTEERYSITMRNVEPTYSRSTIIVGDSNTKEIKFGSGKGTLGEKYPGKRIKAAKISDIDPRDCVGYSNIVLVCGTNDLRPEEHPNVPALANRLIEKARQMRLLCPKSKLFMMPVLPSRDASMNRNVMAFNRRIGDWVEREGDPFVDQPSVVEFLDNRDLLDRRFTRPGDLVHLGKSGICKFVTIIKNSIYNREKFLRGINSQSQRTRPSSRVGLKKPT